MRFLIILPVILLLMGCSHFREQKTVDKVYLEHLEQDKKYVITCPPTPEWIIKGRKWNIPPKENIYTNEGDELE